MGTSLLLQLLIAVFAGMVLATMVGPVRRSLPGWFEALVWLALIVVCWLAVTAVDIGHTRELTESALWGAFRVLTTTLGLLGAGMVGWMLDNRFVISEWMALLLGCDILVLALLRSRRRAIGWQPRVVLGEWFELPIRRAPAPVAAPASESAVDDINRRGAAAASAGLAAIRTTAAPAISSLATKAEDMIDLQAILNAQAIDWFGALVPLPEAHPGGENADQSDRLAS